MKVAILGGGFGLQVHAPAWRAAGAEVIGIATGSASSAAAAGQRLGLRGTSDWRGLVAEAEAVSIAAPPALHAEMVSYCAKAGKALLCEKPLALDARQGVAMLAEAQAAGIPHAMGFEFREIPAFRMLRQLLREQAFGGLRQVTIEWMTGGWASAERPWSWQVDAAQGGGVLGALGVHSFDTIDWIFGPIRALAAHTRTQFPLRRHAVGQERPASAEDQAQVLIELDSGLPLTLHLSSVAARGTGHCITCICDTGTLRLLNGDPRDYVAGFHLSAAGRDEPFREIEISPEHHYNSDVLAMDGRVAPFASLVKRFVQSIEQAQPFDGPDLAVGLRAQRALDAAREAASARQWVSIPLS